MIAAAGLGVYADAAQNRPIDPVTSEVPASPLRLLATQARAMQLEAADGQGLLGAYLDQVVGADPGMPPASYMIAGWVTGSQSPGARYAHTLMGDRDWRAAPAVVFPSLVLALYTADAARFADALSGNTTETGSPPGTTVGSGGVSSGVSGSSTMATRFRGGPLTFDLTALRPLVVGICSQVQGFIDGTISALFDVIGHLETPQLPSTGSNTVDWFVGGLTTALGYAVGAVNGLVDAAHFLVQKLIGQITQPVLGYIAKIAGVLAVISTVVSFLRPWTIRMDASPPQTHKAIGDEPDIAGTVKATVDLGGLDKWPTDIEDCAKAAGVTLPPLKPVGAPIAWTMTQADDLAVQSPVLATSLDDNASAPFNYTTTRESVETSHGDPANSDLHVKASIRRNAVATAQQAISDLIFQQIPDLVRPILYSILQPRIHGLLDTIAGLLDNYGYANVTVLFHQPNQTTTTTLAPTTVPSLTPTAVDPCNVLTEQDAAAALGVDPGPGVSSSEQGVGQCQYGSGNPGSIIFTVVKNLQPLGGKAGFDAVKASTQAQIAANTSGNAQYQTIDGLGDGGFAAGGGYFASASAYLNDTLVTVILSFADVGTTTAVSGAANLIKAAASRVTG